MKIILFGFRFGDDRALWSKARGLATFPEVQPTQTACHADPIACVARLDGITTSEEHLDSMVDLVLFGVRQRDSHPFGLDRFFVLEKGAQFRRIVKQLLKIDFDSFVFFLHGNLDRSGNVGESDADRAVGSVAIREAIRGPILYGSHDEKSLSGNDEVRD